jgi:hypothetical protein
MKGVDPLGNSIIFFGMRVMQSCLSEASYPAGRDREISPARDTGRGVPSVSECNELFGMRVCEGVCGAV